MLTQALTAILGSMAVLFSGSDASALRVVNRQVVLDKLEDYEACQRHEYSGDFCQDALNRWVASNPKDTWKAAKMTRMVMNAWVAIPLFGKAFSAQQGDCKDEDAQLAVVAGLNLPSDRTDIIKTAKKIGLELCFSEMKDKIVDAAETGSYLFKNVCKDLLEKKLLTGLRAKKCQ